MNMKYLFVGICLLNSTQYVLSFKPTRYKKLLQQSLATLEQRQERLQQKIAVHTRPHEYLRAGTFGLSHVQQDIIEKHRKELLKQLEATQDLLASRIKDIKEQQKKLLYNPPKDATEETYAIKKVTLQQSINRLQEKIEDVSRTQTFFKKQRSEQERSGIEVPDEQTLLIQRWALSRTELEDQLKRLQSELSRTSTLH